MTSHMRQLQLARILSTAALFFGMLSVPLLSHAATYFNATPKVVNAKTKAREISNFMLTLKNTSIAVLPIYITIVDVDPEKGERSATGVDSVFTTPSRWFEIGRTQTLLPKEEQSVALRMSVPAQVKSGTYNVLMRLSTKADGSCEECAEEIPITIDVADDAREVMQLSSFMTTKDVFMNDSAEFKLRVSNTGNRSLAPSGKIRIFDKRGNEVGAVDVNSNGKTVNPKAEELIATAWTASGHFGRYKALLDVSYGQRGIMQDTVYFWVIPWGKLSGLFVTILLVLAFAVAMLRGRGIANQYAYADGAEYHDAAFDEPYVEDVPEPHTRVRSSPYQNPAWNTPRAEAARIAREVVQVQETPRATPVAAGAVQLSAREQSYAGTVLEMRSPRMSMGAEVAIAPRAKPGADHQIALGRRERVVAPEHQIRL